jgi:hypothetical protein
MSIGSTTPDFEVTSLREAVEVIAQNPAAAPAEPTPIPAAAAPVAVTPVGESNEVNEEVKQDAEQYETNEPEVTNNASSSVEPEPEVERPLRTVPFAARIAAAEPAPQDESGGASTAPRGKSRQEILLGQILDELKRQHERPADDFSVSMLMAGVVQVIAFGSLFWAYIHRGEQYTPGFSILVGIFMQVFTIALLLWGRQK